MDVMHGDQPFIGADWLSTCVAPTMSLTHSSAFIGCVFLSASRPKLPSSYTAVHPLTRSPTLPTFQVAEDFALPSATALSSLRFTTPLLAAEYFRLLALRCGTASHRRLRRTVSGDLPHSTLDVSVYRVISWHSSCLIFLCLHTVH